MISVVILTKNEEKNIIDCLESIAWVDEIIIVDDYSFDRTIELSESLKNKKINIYKRNLDDNFSEQRNFGLSKAKGDWVLFLDADERVPEALVSEIFNFYPPAGGSIFNSYDGFYVKRRDFMWGKELKYGETGNIKLLRLAKKGTGVWEGKVHEKWIIKGKVGELRNPIFHYPHPAITDFLKEINSYTSIRAKELFDKRVKVYTWQIIFNPIAKFTLNFFVRQGFRDGLQGLVFAIFMSFHSFLVKGKLWLLWQKQKQY